MFTDKQKFVLGASVAMSLEFHLREVTAISTKDAGVIDLVAYRDGCPLAYMVLIDGKIAKHTIYYDGTADSRYSFTAQQIEERKKWIMQNGNEIYEGCLALLKPAKPRLKKLR